MFTNFLERMASRLKVFVLSALATYPTWWAARPFCLSTVPPYQCLSCELPLRGSSQDKHTHGADAHKSLPVVGNTLSHM